MKNIYLLLLLTFTINLLSQCISGSEFSKTTPKRDLRGVFLTSIFNIDWPSSRTAAPAVQQAELLTILDNLRTNGYNTVFMQVRPESDALYESTIEPWSYRLTGTQGLAPSPLWDPLEFAVTAAHARGLDLHAWINPYRVRSSTAEYTAASNSILNTQPSWILTSSNNINQKILNPGLPDVQDYIKQIVVDISTRYNIDGIHFDDYFYPNAGMTTNQDSATFAANNPTNIATIEDWRRNNVNSLITKTFDAIATVNTSMDKNIVFGVSPAGIWKSGTPTGITGNPAFSALFCDATAWLNAGKVDYVAPQTYWKIGGAQDYVSLTKWWNDQAKTNNKHLYLSQAWYRMSTSEGNWDATEIQNQILQNRSINMDATLGQIAYNYSAIKNNLKGLNPLLTSAEFKYKSFAPPILGVGKDAICPNLPINVMINGLNLKWTTPAAASDGDLPIKYVVYAFDSATQAVTNKDDGSKIIDILQGNQLTLSQNQIDTKYFVVSSLDKNNNEAGNFSQAVTLSNFNFLTEKSFSVFPNPFTDSFEIKNNNSSNKIISVEVFDIVGKLIWTQFANSETTVLVNAKNIQKGIYFGKIIFEDGKNGSFKILKN
ncbi:MAG: hypothetical protein RLZZ312_108 [Bacteroidota bacterium]|jgi:uncharacterized lipoprotein YddW (UPF0748 family)